MLNRDLSHFCQIASSRWSVTLWEMYTYRKTFETEQWRYPYCKPIEHEVDKIANSQH